VFEEGLMLVAGIGRDCWRPMFAFPVSPICEGEQARLVTVYKNGRAVGAADFSLTAYR
jgi:hypothetical protein